MNPLPLTWRAEKNAACHTRLETPGLLMSVKFNEICVRWYVTYIRAKSVLRNVRKYDLRYWLLRPYSNVLGRDRNVVQQRGSLPCSFRWPFEALAKKTNSAVPDCHAEQREEEEADVSAHQESRRWHNRAAYSLNQGGHFLVKTINPLRPVVIRVPIRIWIIVNSSRPIHRHSSSSS